MKSLQTLLHGCANLKRGEGPIDIHVLCRPRPPAVSVVFLGHHLVGHPLEAFDAIMACFAINKQIRSNPRLHVGNELGVHGGCKQTQHVNVYPLCAPHRKIPWWCWPSAWTVLPLL